jgi:hypothetical protein
MRALSGLPPPLPLPPPAPPAPPRHLHHRLHLGPRHRLPPSPPTSPPPPLPLPPPTITTALRLRHDRGPLGRDASPQEMRVWGTVRSTPVSGRGTRLIFEFARPRVRDSGARMTSSACGLGRGDVLWSRPRRTGLDPVVPRVLADHGGDDRLGHRHCSRGWFRQVREGLRPRFDQGPGRT